MHHPEITLKAVQHYFDGILLFAEAHIGQLNVGCSP
jgi:hypothetical protein